MKAKQKQVFNKRIFWDVNFEQIDFDAKANFIIERVFERGDVEDILFEESETPVSFKN